MYHGGNIHYQRLGSFFLGNRISQNNVWSRFARVVLIVRSFTEFIQDPPNDFMGVLVYAKIRSQHIFWGFGRPMAFNSELPTLKS